MKIGIFGGSFNPPHLAHQKIIELYIKKAELDKCIIIPAACSPFKQNESLASDSHRIKMLELLSQDIPNTNISEYEIKKGGVSYTYDTIQFIKNKYPNDELFLLIGYDQLISFHKWTKYQDILSDIKLCVALRTVEADNDFIQEKLRVYQAITLENEFMEISSTEIRDRIKKAESLNDLLPASIEEYILSNKLYL